MGERTLIAASAPAHRRPRGGRRRSPRSTVGRVVQRLRVHGAARRPTPRRRRFAAAPAPWASTSASQSTVRRRRLSTALTRCRPSTATGRSAAAKRDRSESGRGRSTPVRGDHLDRVGAGVQQPLERPGRPVAAADHGGPAADQKAGLGQMAGHGGGDDTGGAGAGEPELGAAQRPRAGRDHQARRPAIRRTPSWPIAISVSPVPADRGLAQVQPCAGRGRLAASSTRRRAWSQPSTPPTTGIRSTTTAARGGASAPRTPGR